MGKTSKKSTDFAKNLVHLQLLHLLSIGLVYKNAKRRCLFTASRLVLSIFCWTNLKTLGASSLLREEAMINDPFNILTDGVLRYLLVQLFQVLD